MALLALKQETLVAIFGAAGRRFHTYGPDYSCGRIMDGRAVCKTLRHMFYDAPHLLLRLRATDAEIPAALKFTKDFTYALVLVDYDAADWLLQMCEEMDIQPIREVSERMALAYTLPPTITRLHALLDMLISARQPPSIEVVSITNRCIRLLRDHFASNTDHFSGFSLECKEYKYLAGLLLDPLRRDVAENTLSTLAYIFKLFQGGLCTALEHAGYLTLVRARMESDMEEYGYLHNDVLCALALWLTRGPSTSLLASIPDVLQVPTASLTFSPSHLAPDLCVFCRLHWGVFGQTI